MFRVSESTIMDFTLSGTFQGVQGVVRDFSGSWFSTHTALFQGLQGLQGGCLKKTKERNSPISCFLPLQHPLPEVPRLPEPHYLHPNKVPEDSLTFP